MALLLKIWDLDIDTPNDTTVELIVALIPEDGIDAELIGRD